MADPTIRDSTPQLESSSTPQALRPTSSNSRRTARPSSGHRRPSRPYRHGNSSSTSIDSTTFLDHRDQPQSLGRNMSVSQRSVHDLTRRFHKSRKPLPDGDYPSDVSSEHDDMQEEVDDETMRIIAQANRHQSFAPWTRPRRPSTDETARLLSSERLDTYGSSSRGGGVLGGSSPPRGGRRPSPPRERQYSHVNHPSSMPSSIGSPPPPMARGQPRGFSIAGTGKDGEQVSMPLAQRAQRRLTTPGLSHGDVLIDIEQPIPSAADLSTLPPALASSPGRSSTRSSDAGSVHSRRKQYKPEEDVCFPTEEPSPKALWPDYEVLEDWAAEEGKGLDEGSSDVRESAGFGHRKVSEPVMIDGRYRRAQRFATSLPSYSVHSTSSLSTFCLGLF